MNTCECSWITYNNIIFWIFQGHAHIMSIVLMVNEKFRERVPPWEVRFSNMFNKSLWDFT